VRRLARRQSIPGKTSPTHFIGVFGLLDELSQTIRRIDRTAVLLQRGPRNCQSQLASLASQKKIDRSRMKAPIQSSTIGMNGLTFKASCDSSVAIAPAK
jgi:hypothetical protein